MKIRAFARTVAVASCGLAASAAATPGQVSFRALPNAKHPPVHIGSASEFVNVPDPRAGAALSGIALRLEGAPQPPEESWRMPVAGDPAIRDFHAGDVISYQASVIRAPARDWSGIGEVLARLDTIAPVTDLTSFDRLCAGMRVRL